MGQRFNLIALKIDYVKGYQDDMGKRRRYTQEQLARKYGISIRTVANRAAKEHWAAERLNVEKQVYEQSRDAYAENTAYKLSEFDNMAFTVSAMGMHHILEMLEEAQTDIERDNLLSRYAKIIPALQRTALTAMGDRTIMVSPDERRAVLTLFSGAPHLPQEFKENSI